MNWFDIAVLILLGIGLIKGLFAGLVKQLIALIALVLAFVFSGTVAGIIRNFVETQWHWEANTALPLNTIWYLISFALIVGIFAVLGHLLTKVINLTPIGILNKLAGAVFGVLIWLLCLSFALNTLIAFDSESKLINPEIRGNSITYTPVKNALPLIYPYLREFF